ncbi:MAG: M23 family metallopeptidase [Sphingopyxis sp.]|uniref:M23 family metallopeptidase n=1 Tax=Sphingopyxis sp. TaxID=1908224 RepID=UPI002AB960B6|nr:M23 family metallopeptidase [Sphingopyxis sp.]MDZ3831771.1 M23 family metallopeptidase [Sphingopyxis sp.]
MTAAIRTRGRALTVGLVIGLSSCVPAMDAPAAAPADVAMDGAATPMAPTVDAREPRRTDFELAATAEQGGVLIGVAPADTRSLALDGRAIPVAPDGRFLLAFDRDAGATARLVATFADGRTAQRDIAIAAGRWRIEHVNAPYRGSAASDAEFTRRRPAELAQIAEARARTVESDGWRQSFVWPVKGRFSGFFGSQRVYQGKPGSYHSGTDVAVPAGTPFVAPADGVVVLAASAPFTLEGHLLIVDHGMGLNSAFLHCQRLDVKAGDRVRQGQVLGTVGATGRATGPHMHWGLKWHDARLDPGKLAGPMRR